MENKRIKVTNMIRGYVEFYVKTEVGQRIASNLLNNRDYKGWTIESISWNYDSSNILQLVKISYSKNVTRTI